MEELFEFFAKVTEQYLDVSRQGYTIQDAVADALEDMDLVVIKLEYYHKLMEHSGVPFVATLGSYVP
jgi:hypothetical protein